MFSRQGRAYYYNLFGELRAEDFLGELRQMKAFSGRCYDNLPQSFVNSRYLWDWREGRISNFEYLMAVNRFSSRSVNDLYQYPVFPWVLSDYQTSELCLSQDTVYRDLEKPIGAIDPQARAEAENKYLQCINVPEDPPHHYGSHYSTSGAVVHFLIRLEPYTSQAILLQDGQFDVADRLFSSIGQSYTCSLKVMGDYKELIPELFYLPEALLNLNRLPLGHCQTGTIVDAVQLPAWSGSDPYFFVRKHRAVLDSEKVSEHLPQWLDLIFGYQQTGEAARAACNLYPASTYEMFASELLLKAQRDSHLEGLIDQVMLYGQTPVQLFYTKHHPKKTLKKDSGNTLFAAMKSSKSHKNGIKQCITISDFIGRPVAVFQYLLDIVIILSDKRVGIFKKKPSPERFKESDFRCPEGVVMDCRPLTTHSCAAVLSSYLLTGLHSDYSFKLHSFEKLKLVASVALHIDLVTTVSVDKEYILVGSRDTTLSLWKAKGENEGKIEGVSESLWHLRGHQSGVRQCALLWTMQMAVSLGENGTVLVHSLRTGFAVRRLFTWLKPPYLMDVSKSGLIAICFQPSSREVMVYSHNGFSVKTILVTPGLTKLQFSVTCDSLVLENPKCVQLISVFGEFRPELHTLRAGCKLEVCGLAPDEQSLLRVLKQAVPDSSSHRTLTVDQVQSESQFSDFLEKHGF